MLSYNISKDELNVILKLVETCAACGLGNVSFELIKPAAYVRFKLVERVSCWQLYVTESKRVNDDTIVYTDAYTITAGEVIYNYTEYD